ncbi:MAG: DUF3667 domain-containing protein [Cyclobacteriaceae bacterium]
MDQKKCLNCEYTLGEEDIYCSKCGQRYSERNESVRDFFVNFLGDYFTFDSKIFRSISPLIFKPGFLTTEYLIGKRVRYIPPLRLYIFISILFFLIFKFANQLSGVKINEGSIVSQDIFDYFVDHHWHKVFFILLPLFALILYVFYRRKYANFLPHFIFSLHFHSFLFILLSVYILLTTYIPRAYFGMNKWIFSVVVLVFLIYLFFALKNVFKETRKKLILKLLGISITYALVWFSASLISLVAYYLIRS